MKGNTVGLLHFCRKIFVNKKFNIQSHSTHLLKKLNFLIYE